MLAEEDHRPSDIYRQLQTDAGLVGRDDCPSERTVRRIYDEHQRKPEEERRESALVAWPESMVLGELPWEASRTVLDLLRMWKLARLPSALGHRDPATSVDRSPLVDSLVLSPRPTLAVARWYWRLSLAVPQRDEYEPYESGALSENAKLAIWLAYTNLEPPAVMLDGIELELMFQPWTNAHAAQAYQDVVAAAPPLEIDVEQPGPLTSQLLARFRPSPKTNSAARGAKKQLARPRGKTVTESTYAAADQRAPRSRSRLRRGRKTGS